MRKWDAAKAEVGELVAIDHGMPWSGLKLYRIERLTKTQAHIKGTVLDRLTGRIRGASQFGPYGAFMPSEDDIKESHRQIMAERMRGVDWRKLDHGTLCAIVALLPKGDEEAKR